MKFIVSEEFFEKVPNAYFGIVYFNNFDNKTKLDFTDKMLEEAIDSARERLGEGRVKENPLIIPYRESFKNLGINPNKFMCSIEALITRISKGGEIPHINPIVDICNALSIKYILPVGVHDIANFKGDLEIRGAVAEDIFVPFGSEEVEHPDVGEVVYVSGNEVKTRRWTWRQGEKSKVTEETSHIFVPIDGFTDVNKEEVIALQKELVEILKSLGIEAVVDYVDKDKRSFEV